MAKQTIKAVDNVDKVAGVDGMDGMDAEAAFDAGVDPAGPTDPVVDVEPEGAVEDDPGPGVGEPPAEDDLSYDGVAADAGDGDWEVRFKTLEKRLHDNQAWATRVAQENAELKQKQAGGKAPVEAAPGNPAPEDIPEDIRAYYETDPGLQKAVAYEAERLIKERFGAFDPRTVDQRLAETQDRLAQRTFEMGVLQGIPTPGGFVKGHPDALEVMSSPKYREWFSAETQRDPSILSVSDPVQAIGVLDRYKASVAEAAAQKTNEARNAQAEQVTDIMSGAVSKGNRTAGRGKSFEVTPEAAFEEGIK